MSRIDDLVAKHCLNGVSYVRIAEAFSVISSPRGIKRSEYSNGTKLAIVDQGQSLIAGYTDDLDLALPDGEYVVFGDHTRAVKWIDFPFAVGADGTKVLQANELLLPKYAYYALDALEITDRGYNRHWTLARERSIPVPPLEVQRAIVEILDKFSKLEAELEAELEARKQQYEHYQTELLSFSTFPVEWATLGDVGRVAMCKRIFKHQTTPTGDVPFFKIGTFGGKPDSFITRELYEDYKARFSFPARGTVLLSAAGTIGRAIPYDGEPAYFQDSNIVWLEHDESLVLNSYLRYWYRTVKWNTDGGTIKRLYNSNLLKTKIAIPSIDEQRRIVSILDKFDALVNDLSSGLPAELAARRQQYEYYRDKLLTFKELEVAS